ncbi:type II toxin-antitoxin system VapC family toxin [Thermoflexus sp.]|uniref:type II toxin-antitoxin system VapC family toxin n=1 Tax=Thermoflexus sp. TaxID=1969742 RepID=UPI00177424A3|nr:type II toxin-antitoxin system VapC family toxin [Thermoflexus sp.]
MRLLLDTHVLPWALAEPERLPARVQEWLVSPANDVLFSVASIWEIAIKAQIGRLSLSVTVEEIMGAARASGFQELPVRAVHAAPVGSLPLHHRDPFDRILVAQAITEPARLLTVDPMLARYSELVEGIA